MDALLDHAFSPIAEAVESRRIPGAVLGIVDAEGARAVRVTGAAQKVPHHRPMQRETWFDLASLTKVIFTTPRILELAKEGIIDLDAPLISVLPDLRQYAPEAWERKVTFRQCLGHQTPFPAVVPIYTYGRDPDLLRAFVLQHEWTAGPAVYSDINFILLGLALERIHKVRRMRELDPGAGFAWSAAPEESAATEDCTWRYQIMCGTVHDDNCHALEGSGHAGLFGTVDSVLDFALGLLNGTGASSIELARTPLSDMRTHGWERTYIGWPGGDAASAGTIGHTGFTGTGLWIDFDKRRAWTLLTNRIHPTRHFDSGIAGLRRAVGDRVSTQGDA
uniref:serine hydrolase domain-containing protein n=1 Tax=Chelativorans sp. YIM 93263 TaxID=2906648 RepID=UPI0023799375|nr:serine hydrolase [Chelativorans sp. YIM 93263]